MIHFLVVDRPDLLAYRVTDILTEEDVQGATDAFDAILGEHATVHLYAEVEGLSGFEVRALWLDLVYGLRHLGALQHIGRVALVTDGPWVRRLARLEGRLMPVGRMNVYDPSQRAEARTWVAGAPIARREDDATPPPADAATLSDLEVWIGRGGHGMASADAAWFDDDFLDEDLDDDRSMGVAPERRPRAPRFGHTVHRTHVLLRAVADALEVEGSVLAYHALRAVLHALRDRLPDAEAADLAAQLTTIVRGVFYEGYRPGRPTEKVGRAAFLTGVEAGLRDDTPFDAEAACAAVGAVLATTVSAGEWGQVLNALPHDIRELFEATVSP